MQTIAELQEFQRKARGNKLSYSTPSNWSYFTKNWGIRKFRWASGNKGKSGGVRVIYYFYNESIPLFLLSVFGKKEKANLSKSERNELAKFTKQLVKNYGESNV
jgi:mRNA-degrading endonuclease RelE of RelBE toxin-antitoxin system